MTTATQVMAQHMHAWFRGDVDAAAFCLDMWNIVQVWDDLVDRDAETPADVINETFRRAVYTIPTNPFYAAHAHELAPLVHNVVLQWQIANTFEQEREEGDVDRAWMLRAGIYQLFVYVAGLAVDPVWAAVVGPSIWRTYGESLADFHEEMNDA